MQQLFSGQDADGNSASIEHHGGFRTVAYEGDFGGGTLIVQMSPDGGTTWIAVTDASWTADGAVRLGPLAPCLLRFNLASSTSPDLNAWM